MVRTEALRSFSRVGVIMGLSRDVAFDELVATNMRQSTTPEQPGLSRPQDATRDGIELGDQLGIASLRRRDQRIVERAVRAHGAHLVLSGKVASQARDQCSC